MTNIKRMYISKWGGSQYKAGYTWCFKVQKPDKSFHIKTCTNLEMLTLYRNKFLQKNYPGKWKKVIERETKKSQPKKNPKINYSALPIGKEGVI